MRIGRIIVIFLFAMSFTAVAFAQEYPTKPVKVIVPFTAGSATDVFARILGQKLSELWGQPLEIENVPGAGGTVGAGKVAKAQPDGYTLLMTSSAHAINPALYSKLPYDTLKDFINIAPFAKQPFVLVVGRSAGVKNVSELIKDAKAKPGQVKFGSAGTGSGAHFVAEKFKLAAGIDTVHSPYKGGPEANADTMAGRVTYWFPPVAMALKEVQAGNLLALAITSAKRSDVLPNVPTMAEAGVAVEDVTWWGVWAPAGVPVSLVNKIAESVEQALVIPEVREKLAKLGAEPMSMSSAEFASFVRSEIEAAVRIAKAAGIKPQ